jgi:ubiquinone/menaquinone biosynthesis C-methylase UbiE/uncharacterized protein YbaR (Trm112 family)
LEYLTCPYCKGELNHIKTNREYYVCKKCDKNYPIIDNIPRLLDINDEILGQAKRHWEDSPHFQYEAQAKLYSKEYYEEQDQWRKNEVDPFLMNEYRFNEIKGKVILDIGCGSGWVIKEAAKNGAFPIGVDFTQKAAISSRTALDTYNLDGLVIQADAQFLPLKNDSIDRVYSIGVLHHIPNTEQGIEEAYRVLKKDGTGFISLYGKLFFFNPILFPTAIFFLRLFLKAPKVRDGIQNTKSYDEFYRYMDGPTNPIGKWYTDEELMKLFYRFQITSLSRSHFPLRYLKFANISFSKVVPKFMHKFLEKNAGMMRNLQLKK